MNIMDRISYLVFYIAFPLPLTSLNTISLLSKSKKMILHPISINFHQPHCLDNFADTFVSMNLIGPSYSMFDWLIFAVGVRLLWIT